MKIGILGCTGRMGRMLVRQIISSNDCELGGGTVRSKSPHLGVDIGEALELGSLGIKTTDDSGAVYKNSDVTIDFTRPEATEGHLQLAVKYKVPMVIGTTGLSKHQRQAIATAAAQVPIVFAPNMSVGINLLTSLVKQVASLLDDSFDIEVLDVHHRYKLDAPSGTAIALGRAAAEGRGVTLEETANRCRTGKRQQGEIGFAAIRGGEVIGDSKVIFAGDYEMIELSHRALNRKLFASGAVRAALWLKNQEPGFYNMKDVLGL